MSVRTLIFVLAWTATTAFGQDDPRASDPERVSVPTLLIAAAAADAGARIDLFREELRLRAWLGRDGNRERVDRDPHVIHEFDALEAAAGGPLSRSLRWYPLVETFVRGLDPATLRALGAVRLDDGRDRHARSPELVALIPIDVGAAHFTAVDVAPGSVSVVQDEYGSRVLGFRMLDERRAAFEAWTRERVGRRLAFCLGGRCIAAARVDAPLTEGGILGGKFSPEALAAEVAEFGRASTEILVDVRRETPKATVRTIAEGDRCAGRETARLRADGAPIVTFDELAERVADADPAVRGGADLVGAALEVCTDSDGLHVLLVESAWSCAFGMPPGPERTVHVVVSRDAMPQAGTFEGRIVRVTGSLRRRVVEDADVTVSRAAASAGFRMDAIAIVPIDGR